MFYKRGFQVSCELQKIIFEFNCSLFSTFVLLVISGPWFSGIVCLQKNCLMKCIFLQHNIKFTGKHIFLPIKLKISYFKCSFWLDLWFSIQKGKLFFWKKEMQLSQYCRLYHILIWIFWTLKEGKNGFWCIVEAINLENAYLFVRDSFCNLCGCCCNILYQLYLIFLVFVSLLCFSLWLFNLD